MNSLDRFAHSASSVPFVVSPIILVSTSAYARYRLSGGTREADRTTRARGALSTQSMKDKSVVVKTSTVWFWPVGLEATGKPTRPVTRTRDTAELAARMAVAEDFSK